MIVVALCATLIAEPRFEQKTLSVEGDVDRVVAADFDGDGKKDLLAFYKRGIEPKETRHLALFWNRAGRFYEKPDELIAVESDACAFDVAALDDVGGDELLIIGPRGVSARTFANKSAGAAKMIATVPTIFRRGDTSTLPRLHIVHDLAKDGSRDLVIMVGEGLAIFRRGEAGYEAAAHLDVDLESDIDADRQGRAERASKNVPSVAVTIRFPAITVADTDGDGLRDLILSIDDRIAVYRQTIGLKFAAKPSLVRDFAVRTEEDRKVSWSWVGVSIVDLDIDGAADIVLRKNVAKGIASASATTYLFLGRKGGAYPAKADQILTSEGAAGSEVDLFDITGDGHADLIVPSIDIGILEIISFLTSRSVEINTQVYSFDAKKRRFTEKPIAERELDIDLALEGEADSEAIDMLGDYDGDRRPDLAYATGPEELSLFRGLGEGTLFSEDATEKIAVRSFGQLISVDLNQHGRSDIVLYYPRTSGHRSEIVVIRNLTR